MGTNRSNNYPVNQSINQSINRSIDLYCITKKIVTQCVQVGLKLEKLVKSLSQLPINYYRHRVKKNVHQTIKTSKSRQTTTQQAPCKATRNYRLIMLNHGNTVNTVNRLKITLTGCSRTLRDNINLHYVECK